MTPRLVVRTGFLLLAGCTGAGNEELDSFPDTDAYHASPAQRRADASFSDVPIETPLSVARSRLTEIRVGNCQRWADCEWRDADGVRHYFFNDLLVVKMINPADFSARPIRALGIGVARDRERVLEAVRQFLPEAELDCSTEGEADGSEHCMATLRPGWLTIAFDASGSLTEVKLDGYQFS